MINTINVVCDRREYEDGSGKLMEELEFARVVVDDFDAGSYRIADGTMVRRITAKEFVASSVNRKLYPEIELMREQNDQVIMVIEGCALTTRSFIEPESMIEALAWLAITAGVQTVLSDSIDHSVSLIAQMARLCQYGLSYQIPLRHATPMQSTSVLTRYVLEGLPGVTPGVASILGKEFGNLHNLANAGLEEIQATPGIGSTMGKKIYHVLRSGEPQERARNDAQPAEGTLAARQDARVTQ